MRALVVFLAGSAFVAGSALVAGCATAPPVTPPAAAPASPAPMADAADPLGGVVVPVVRVVAGRADTLVAADLFGRDLSVTWGTHADVRVTPASGGRLAVVARDGFSGVALVPFTVAGETRVLAVQASVEPEVTFRFAPDLRPGQAPPADVFVIGAFNDWSRTADRLTRGADGAFSLTRRIPPGRYEYKFTADGAEVMDPARPDSVPNPFGAYNNVLVVASAGEAPRIAWHGAAFRGDPSLVAVPVRPAREMELVDPDDAEEEFTDATAVGVVLVGNREVPTEAIATVVDTLVIDLDALPPGPQHLRVAVRHGATVSNWIALDVRDRRVVATGPFSWTDAVVYQIVVDRFRNGDPGNDAPVRHDSLDARANFYGGDLQGVLDAIEDGYFDGLGVRALWLSPVYRNPDDAFREFPPPHRYYSGYHGYWPVAPREVDPRLGDLALLRRVVDAAHARGLRVLLDYVANHVHEDHPYFREHRDWFGTLALPDGSLNLRRWDDYRLTTWFEPYLPSFDFDAAPEAVDQMTADAVWWLRETGADGFRHDAVKHVPNGFWRALTARLRAELPERWAAAGGAGVYQIGETFGSHALVSSYVVPGQLAAQFNFNLYDVAVPAFARGGSLAAVAAEVERSLEVYGPLHTMGNPMSSHDKIRFLAHAENDVPPGADGKAIGWSDAPPRVDDPASYRRLELAHAYLFTTPGVPVLYYGDEVGMTGADDPDNRRPMTWTGLAPEQERLREATAALVRLRRDVPALRAGSYETLEASATTWTFRRAMPGSEAVVSLNTGARTVYARLPPGQPGQAAWRDALDPARALTRPRPLVVVPASSVEVPPGEYRILVR